MDISSHHYDRLSFTVKLLYLNVIHTEQWNGHSYQTIYQLQEPFDQL